VAVISIFAPQGRLAAPIYVKFGKGDRHMGRLAMRNFTSIGAPEWERGSQSGKKIHFLVESPRRGELFDRAP